jgi:hypothetical protein
LSIGETPEPRLVGSARDVAEKMLFAGPQDGELGRVIFLIGAGCSISAGIPGAVETAHRMTSEVARRFRCCSDKDDCVTAYRGLVQRNYLTDAGAPVPLADQSDDRIDWYSVYDEMFRRHYATPDDTRQLFGKVVGESKGAINWAHMCLGELVSRGFVSTVLTTNFDQLVLSGVVRAGLLPVVCDGVESLNRIAGAPRHPQLIELHGSRHTYLLRNRPEDVKEVWQNPQASAAVQKLLQNATTFVVVGYGGREEGVMELLIQAAEVYRDKNLFWVQYSADPKTLNQKAKRFLGTSRNGGLLVAQDADVFFLELCRELGVGAPMAISEPLRAVQQVIRDIEASRVANDDIRSEIESAKARSSLLSAALANAIRTEDDVIAKIREKRLSGNHAEAYRLAEEALAK